MALGPGTLPSRALCPMGPTVTNQNSGEWPGPRTGHRKVGLCPGGGLDKFINSDNTYWTPTVCQALFSALGMQP